MSRIKAERCGVCGLRLLDRDSLLSGTGYHVGLCITARSAIVSYVAGWWSSGRAGDAFGLMDQAHAEVLGLTNKQAWGDLCSPEQRHPRGVLVMSECSEYLVKVVRAVGFKPDDDGPHQVLCAVADMVERLGADVEYSDVTDALRSLTGRDMDDADASFLRQASVGVWIENAPDQREW